MLYRYRRKNTMCFVTCSKRQISYVNELYDVIRTLGITVFYDSTAITWGDKWKEK